MTCLSVWTHFVPMFQFISIQGKTAKMRRLLRNPLMGIKLLFRRFNFNSYTSIYNLYLRKKWMQGSRRRKNKCSIVNSNIFIFHFKLGKRLNLKLLMILHKHASVQRKKTSIEKHRFTLLTANRFFELNNKFWTESSISVFVIAKF